MAESSATTQTHQASSATDVPVTPMRTVTYLFNTGAWNGASSSELGIKIPYQVAFDGVVQQRHQGWPQRIIGRRPFRIQVAAGTEVSLFLNTDSLEGFRQHPVYGVTPNERDAYVTITETRGQTLNTPATATLDRTGMDEATKRQTDFYTAPMHGNIWAQISRAYTEADAEAQIPATADAGVRAAVISIYRILTNSSLIITCDSPESHRITVNFVDSDNPRQNITNYDLLRDGLTRVHPLGFYNLFEAARIAELTRINITSCWRPSLGSIAHRAGIGLDVNIIANANEDLQLNRAELIGRGPDTASVSPQEPALYRQRGQDRQAWTAEVERTKPGLFQVFRDYLQNSPHVQQLFDPWYMDANTRDNVEPTYNEQSTANERLHNNHLHVTLNIPGIL